MNFNDSDKEKYQSKSGEQLGYKLKSSLNQFIYFIVGKMILGSYINIYSFVNSFSIGWENANKMTKITQK